MLASAATEPTINHGQVENIFTNEKKLQGNIFTTPGGFYVMDKDLRPTEMNMPL